MNRRNGTIGLLLTVLIISCAGAATASTKSVEDYGAVSYVPRTEIDEWVRSEVARHGGNFDAQRYHFVIGFSTGHFGSDPVHAIAMRRVAFTILNKTLSPGDLVTPIAWEMNLWDVGPTIRLTEDPQTRAGFVNTVPYAPMHGSRGGHDIERTLHETLTRVVSTDTAPATVILLLTNTNQSQGPIGGGELVGSDYPALRQAIADYGYGQPVRHTFAAKSRDGNRSLAIDVTALFPAQMTGFPDAPTTKRVAFPEKTWQPPGDRPTLSLEQSKAYWWLGALALLALLVWWWYRSRKGEKTESAPKSPPGRPVPGQLILTFGAGANEEMVTIENLTSGSEWILYLDEGDQLEFEDQSELDLDELDGRIVARAAIDAKRRLRITAEDSYEFWDQMGHTEESNAHLLLLSPGQQILATPLKASSGSRLPLTRIQYQKEV